MGCRSLTVNTECFLPGKLIPPFHEQAEDNRTSGCFIDSSTNKKMHNSTPGCRTVCRGPMSLASVFHSGCQGLDRGNRDSLVWEFTGWSRQAIKNRNASIIRNPRKRRMEPGKKPHDTRQATCNKTSQSSESQSRHGSGSGSEEKPQEHRDRKRKRPLMMPQPPLARHLLPSL